MRRLSGSAAAVVVALMGAAVLPPSAAAAIYGWVDASGSMTYSNLPPPNDARVVVEIEDIAPPTPQAQAAADAAHQAEMRALQERLHQLESERRYVPDYAAPSPPPYPVPAPTYGPPPQYASTYAPDCDPDVYDCYGWAGPPVYFTTIAPPRGFRRHDRDGFHHGSRFPRPVGGTRFASGSHAASFSAGGGRSAHF
ncbi:MAG: DUF4124 domain-containing protein [Burkholderiaceae bacterium]|nr:DUF4124 domain-containing protein [Burkholderiaceae bacterium]